MPPVRFLHLRVGVLTLLASAAHLAAQSAPGSLTDLPLTEVPASRGDALAVFWSGDGGWAALTNDVSKELAANGVAVIGINARSWLDGGKRGPDDATRDTERILRTYLARWSRSRILLLGYSRGAGFAPFIVNRLPADLRERVELVGLLGAEHAASFEFHLMDLVKTTARSTDLPVLPEVERAARVRFLCLYGTTEKDTICPQLDAARATVIARTGDHHFDRNYPAIAHDILGAIPGRP